MSKTFICLDGISGFSGNATSAVRLLKEQIAEFYIRRSLRDGKNLVTEGILMAPNLLNNALRYGLTKGLAKEVSTLENIHAGMEQALANYKEALAMLRREA